MRACHRDAAEPGIRAEVEKAGGTWQPLNGKDIPDALVGFAGQTELWEIKTGNAKLKPGQDRWHKAWRGSPVRVVRTEAHARKALRAMAEAAPTLCDVVRALTNALPRPEAIVSSPTRRDGGGESDAPGAAEEAP
jgi:hypothetical protein